MTSLATPSPLVGRERELALLRQRLAAASHGQGTLVLIGGEAGIGKTALAEVLCRQAAEQGALVLVGRCFDLSETPPYGPWIELFAQYQAGNDVQSLPAGFAQRGNAGPVASQGALFREVRDFFAAVAGRQPVLLLLDDLQWADPASLDLLRFLARSLSGMPLLLLAVYRADELTRRHPLSALLPALIREAAATRVDLHRLGEANLRALVTARYPLADADTDRLVSYLHGRSEGNPFFVGELLYTLEGEHLLLQKPDGWTLGDLAHLRVPSLLRQVIDGRLARLDVDAQELLAAAAVIGQEVSLGVWNAATDADEETLGATIEQGIEWHMLETLPDSASVRFVHALIRETLYEGIAPLRRRAWHRQIGEALLTLPRPDPDAVAYHFRQAGDARAAKWLTSAGERAHRAFAWQTAIDRYEAALALTEGSEADLQTRGWLLFRLADVSKFVNVPRTITYLHEAERLGVAVGDEALVANARFSLGIRREDIRQGLGEMEAAVEALRALAAEDQARMKAMEIFEGLDAEYAQGRLLGSLGGSGRYAQLFAQAERVLPEVLHPAATGKPVRPGLVWAYRGLAFAHAARGQPAEARVAFRLAQEALLARGDYLETGLNALNELRYVLLPYLADDVTECQRVAAEAERWYAQAIDHNWLLPPQRGSLPLMVVDGRWSEARSVAQAVLAVGGTGAYLGNARSVLCPLAYAQGDVAQATTLIHEVLPAGPVTDPGTVGGAFRDALTLLRVAAAVAIDAGKLPEARTWLEAHDRWLAWSGSVLGQAEGALSWAAYSRATGDRTRADLYGRRALAHATTPRQPLALIAAHRLGGELTTAARRFADAATHLDSALTLADVCAAPYERALTLLSLATLCATSHNTREATRLLGEVHTTCTSLGARPAVARADALAARLAASGTRPVYPAGLSAREIEILRLVAAGRTNREIADALFVSLGTVNNHLVHILTKTDSANRAEATAFALRHGLA